GLLYQDVYAPLHRCDGVWSMRGNRRGNDENIQFDLLEHSLDIVEIRGRSQDPGQVCAEARFKGGELVLGPVVGAGDEVDGAGGHQWLEGAQMHRAVSKDAGNRYPNHFLGWRTHEGNATVNHAVSVSATAGSVKSAEEADATLNPVAQERTRDLCASTKIHKELK